VSCYSALHRLLKSIRGHDVLRLHGFFQSHAADGLLASLRPAKCDRSLSSPPQWRARSCTSSRCQLTEASLALRLGAVHTSFIMSLRAPCHCLTNPSRQGLSLCPLCERWLVYLVLSAYILSFCCFVHTQCQAICAKLVPFLEL
jgi:hypothetical protein